MTLVRWEPVRELPTLQEHFDRLFGSFFEPVGRGNARHGVASRWTPAVDLVEDADHFTLRADLPGLRPDDVDIEVADGVLTISGRRDSEEHAEHAGYERLERSFGSFRRSLTLPEGIDPDAVQAGFDRGVLEVRIPKPAERTPHRVPIAVGDTGDGGADTIEAPEA
jgi:HSP20 family protein